jgi:deoxycytidylate deaminase
MEAKNIKYPYLPKGRTIEYVDESNPYMARAKEVARTSKDQSFPTGAVIVCDGEVISEACSKPPLSSKKLINWHKNGFCIRRILKIPSGQKYWLCPGCAKSSNHGEYRAVIILQKKFPQKVNTNCDLYLWGHWWCCKPCWDKMIEIGIKKVFLLKDSEILFDINNPQNIMGKQFE